MVHRKKYQPDRRLTISTAWMRLVVVLLVFCGSGASCVRPWGYPPTAYGPPAPTVLTPIPSLEAVIAAVNGNAVRVSSFISHNASISMLGMPGMPVLSGSIAMARPASFRLQAGTALLGPEVDLGSNDSTYWIWIRRSQPKAVYVGRHDLFAQSAARDVMPVEPDWFLDALGLAQFDPNAQHQGPIPRPDGKLEIRSTLPSPSGTVTKVTVVDATRAWVLEQHIYSQTGTLLASAVARSHRYYPAEQVSLPQVVEIHLPPAKLALSIDVGTVMINQLVGDPALLWGLPQLGDPVVSLDGAAGGTPQPPIGISSPGTTDVVPPGIGWKSR